MQKARERDEKMKKPKKRSLLIGSLFTSLLVFLFSTTSVQAAEHQMTDMHIHVELLEDGTAIITENRTLDIGDEGTEFFIEMDENNLGESELSNFEVTGFEYNPDWDGDASFEEKAGRYGVEEISNGTELIWGISGEGQQEYELSYQLTNVVRELEDGQALHWDFQTYYDIPPQSFSIEIEGPEAFDESNTNIWGFGFEGEIELVDGSLIWEATEPLEERGQINVLMQFTEDLFSPSVSEDMTFSEQQEMAEEGSGYNTSELSNWWIWLIGGIGLIGAAAVAIGISVSNRLKEAGHIPSYLGEYKKRNKGQTHDASPYTEGELADVAYFLHQYSLNGGSFEDLFFAHLLKWSVEEKIQIETKEEKSFFGASHSGKIEIQNFAEEAGQFEESFGTHVEKLVEKEEGSYESALWHMLIASANTDGVITTEYMKVWAKKQAKVVEKLAEGLKDYSVRRMEELGYIVTEEIKLLGGKKEIEKATAKGEQLIDHLFQFRNYLDELDLKKAASIDETLSWEELIIWAAVYGEEEAEEILEGLEEFFPEFYQELYTAYPHFYHGHIGFVGFRSNWSDGLASGGYHASSGAGGMTSVGGGAGAGGGATGGGAR